MSCFALAYYFANQPCTLARSRSALVFGQGFSQVDTSAASRVSHTASEYTVWVSDCSLRLRVASSRNVGGGATKEECAQMDVPTDACMSGSFHIRSQQRLAITVAYTAGTVTDVFSYDAPSLSSYRLANGPMNQNHWVSIGGSGFGRESFTPRARFGGCLAPADPWSKWHGSNLTTYCEHGYTAPTAATSTAWRSDSTVVARVASGVRDRMSVSASVGISVGTQTFVFSYDSWPRIYGVQPTNLPKRGSADETLTSEISGVNFGAESSSTQARVGRTACEHTVWRSETSLVCWVAPGVDFERLGNGTWLDHDRGQPRYVRSGLVAITVSAELGLLTTSSWLFSYDTPSLAGRDVVSASAPLWLTRQVASEMLECDASTWKWLNVFPSSSRECMLQVLPYTFRLTPKPCT